MTNNENWTYYRAAQGLLLHRDRVLLVGNDYGYPDLAWSLPGGRLEEGEQYTTALHREFLEEVGLEIIPGDLLYVVDARSEKLRRQFTSLIFAAHLPDGIEPEPVCETDGPVKDVRFVPVDEVYKMIPQPSLGEGLISYLYYGQESPRYWHYPEYITNDFTPNAWPPRRREQGNV